MNTDKIYAEQVANEYAVKDTSKVIALKKLDRKAKRPASVFGWTFGTVSALVMGAGMCFSMNVIGNGTQQTMIMGIVLGVIGIIGAVANYPIYKKIKNSSKAKYASDIIELAKTIEAEAN